MTSVHNWTYTHYLYELMCVYVLDSGNTVFDLDLV